MRIVADLMGWLWLGGDAMKWGTWLNKFEMSGLRIKTPFLEADIQLSDADKKAAWHLYVELLTRIATQPLVKEHGDEQAALDSVFSLFGSTRTIIKEGGPRCINFSKIAIVVLNQIVRPFTAKWHRLSLDNAFHDKMQCEEFRGELEKLQTRAPYLC